MTGNTARVLGMDLCTSSLKCVVLGADGSVNASAERNYPTSRPQPGWAEQHPTDWDEALRGALAELAASGGLDGLAAVGLCSAAHLPVLLDAADRVIRPAILWSDQRSEAEVAKLRRRAAPARNKVRAAQTTGAIPPSTLIAAPLM